MKSKIVTLPTVLALSIAPFAGCGDDKEPTTTDTSGADTSTTDTNAADTATNSDAVSESGCLLEAPADLTGTWAILETETALVTNVPGIGTMNQMSKNLFLATISDDGGALSMETTLCDWSTSDDANLTTTGMTQALLNSLDPVTRSVAIEAGAEARFKTGEGISLRGVTMDDADADAFPTETTDTRIFDQEEDTKPGITLVIGGLFQGELYVIHRNRTTFDGCFKSADKVEGASLWTTEQLILSSNPEELAGFQPTAQTHPDATLSYFTMVRATDVTDCAALKTAREDLLGE